MAGRLPAAQRREQLLDVAASLFASRGYAGATTAQIAKEAGVTEPIIYRHFKSKRDLFVALVERTGKQTLVQWEKDLGKTNDPAKRIFALLSENPMVSGEGRLGYRVMLQSLAEIEDEAIHNAVAQHMTTLHGFISGEVRRAQEAHKITRRFSAEVVAWVLVNIGMGYGVLEAMGVPGHGRDLEGVSVRDVLARILIGPDLEERAKARETDHPENDSE